MRADPVNEPRVEQAGRIISEPEGADCIKKYGIPYPEHVLARTVQEAEAAAARLGYPVVLKVASPDIAHKTDAGGVVANIGNPEQLARAYRRILQDVERFRPGARTAGMLVCQQAPEGVEVIAGAVMDPVFGPTIMFGMGGVLAELLGDVAFRLAPLKPRDARAMIREIKGYHVLTGARGRAGCDLDAAADLLLALSRLIQENPGLVEMDLNPVRLYPDGLMALDVHLVVKNDPSDFLRQVHGNVRQQTGRSGPGAPVKPEP